MNQADIERAVVLEVRRRLGREPISWYEVERIRRAIFAEFPGLERVIEGGELLTGAAEGR